MNRFFLRFFHFLHNTFCCPIKKLFNELFLYIFNRLYAAIPDSDSIDHSVCIAYVVLEDGFVSTDGADSVGLHISRRISNTSNANSILLAVDGNYIAATMAATTAGCRRVQSRDIDQHCRAAAMS